jgi:2-keto-3-deoxy-L-rhamnonate aldolase RhmA
MGMPAEVGNPRVQTTIDEIVRRGNAAGKAVGVGGNSDLEGVQRTLKRGARYITIGFTGFLKAAARELLHNLGGSR